MKIIITGGHITPALALIPLLKKKHQVLFVIRKNAYEGNTGLSFEYKTSQALGVPYKIINTGRLQRRLSMRTIPSLVKIPIGVFQAVFILSSFRPDVVLSFGGYVAFPVCFVAWLFGIPIVTHEQTIKTGLANKIIAFFAKKVCVSFPQAMSSFPKEKVVHTGNPLRKEILTPAKSPVWFSAKEDFPVIYITGGSGGSHTINMFVDEIRENLLMKYIVIHQAGLSYDFEEAEKQKKQLPLNLQKRYFARDHITGSELAWIYRNAAFLVGRSGANTVYEILALRVPSLLLPFNEEQMENAKLVEEEGLATIRIDDELTGKTFLTAIEDMIV